MAENIAIEALTPADASALARAIDRCPRGYLRYFKPFPFDAATLRQVLSSSRRDRYWGLRVGRRLAGFLMLRGFDQGYAIPSYGVFVSKDFSNLGLSRLAMQYALSWCRANRVTTLMLKCHPKNERALKVYREFGFERSRRDAKSTQTVFLKQLSTR